MVLSPGGIILEHPQAAAISGLITPACNRGLGLDLSDKKWAAGLRMTTKRATEREDAFLMESCTKQQRIDSFDAVLLLCARAFIFHYTNRETEALVCQFPRRIHREPGWTRSGGMNPC